MMLTRPSFNLVCGALAALVPTWDFRVRVLGGRLAFDLMGKPNPVGDDSRHGLSASISLPLPPRFDTG